MPTYEYKCEKCHKIMEVFQSITAKPLCQCPICRGKLKRLIGSGAGILFKGSGFYQTDYRSAHYKKRMKEEKKAATTSASTKDVGSGAVAKPARPGAAG